MAKRQKPDDLDPANDAEIGDLPEWDEQDQDDRTEDEEQWPDDVEVGADPTVFGQPKSRKAWIALASIFAIIAVAVLYVYQAGDDKTILGNQPIPAALQEGGGTGGAGIPQGALGAASPTRAPAFAGPGGAGTGGLTVRCPYCGNEGLPMCSKCNAVMQQLGGNSGLYACSSCGTAGVPICPRCNTRMSAW